VNLVFYTHIKNKEETMTGRGRGKQAGAKRKRPTSSFNPFSLTQFVSKKARLDKNTQRPDEFDIGLTDEEDVFGSCNSKYHMRSRRATKPEPVPESDTESESEPDEVYGDDDGDEEDKNKKSKRKSAPLPDAASMKKAAKSVANIFDLLTECSKHKGKFPSRQDQLAILRELRKIRDVNANVTHPSSYMREKKHSSARRMLRGLTKILDKEEHVEMARQGTLGTLKVPVSGMYWFGDQVGLEPWEEYVRVENNTTQVWYV
jgi:hypothetical protein